MSNNVHARQKDNTHIVKGACKVLIPRQHSDQEFLNPVKYLFGIANTSLATASGISNYRSGGSVTAVKVFNFGRDKLTHVMANGFRAQLPIVDYNTITITGKTIKTRMHVAEDLMGLVQLAANYSVPVDNTIVIAQNIRLVAESTQEIRLLCRCMHFPPDVIAALERAPTFTTVNQNSQWQSLDVVVLVTIDPSILEHHDNVLEAYTGVMISRKDVWTAPAHFNDRTGEAIEPARPVVSGIQYERSTVSNCVLVYHDIGYTHRFTHDCGVVVEIPQICDFSKREGFYKEWHHFDDTGKFRITRHFIERAKITNANGFFARSLEALNYTPKKEIEEIYEGISKCFATFADQLRVALKDAVRDISEQTQTHRDDITKILREQANQTSATENKLREEVERLKKENNKHEKEKEDLRHEMREAKSFKKETSELLKVVASSIGLVAVVLTQFKPKKKVT